MCHHTSVLFVIGGAIDDGDIYTATTIAIATTTTTITTTTIIIIIIIIIPFIDMNTARHLYHRRLAAAAATVTLFLLDFNQLVSHVFISLASRCLPHVLKSKPQLSKALRRDACHKETLNWSKCPHDHEKILPLKSHNKLPKTHTPPPSHSRPRSLYDFWSPWRFHCSLRELSQTHTLALDSFISIRVTTSVL